MSADDAMKIDYTMVLKQLQGELDGIDDRRQALLASIAAIKRLVEPNEREQEELYLPRAGVADSTVRMPVIPPDFFRGKTPTQAYRDLMRVWPGHYRAPQIADLFAQGGLASTGTRTTLVQAIHSVLKRERKRAAGASIVTGG